MVQNLVKHSFVIYANFKTLLKKIDGSEKNPKESFTVGISLLWFTTVWQCQSNILMVMIK